MGRRKTSHRALTPSEAALWQSIATSVTPLSPPSAAPTSVPPDQVIQDPAPARLSPGRRMIAPAPPHPPSLARSPLQEGDPRKTKRVARGRQPIDATLDLHGLTQIQAEQRLFHFLELAMVQQHRTVLVITGKGSTDADAPYFDHVPRGILRRRFLEWIETGALRRIVSSVSPAHQRHGGRGAFYVFLKNSASTP